MNTIRDNDVVILGGGLAGLTLALQLRLDLPAARISVIERRRHPVEEGAHKVGESTVEIGAEYLANMIGLKDHLDQCHLRKYGLRLFFDANQFDDLALAGELGASHLLSLPSYQIDRGVLENHLAERVQASGIELINDATVVDIGLNEDKVHDVTIRTDQGERQLTGRWLVDAMGRASLIKRRLDLAEDNDHHCSSVWFRVQDRIDVSDWSSNPDWQARCSQLPRWHSTNHLVGPGYWVWLIPLASGSTSIGVVFDNRMHDFKQFTTYQGTLDWLADHQPRCHQAIQESNGALQDFLYLRRISYGCRQVYSEQRWALTGEAGVFLDPFYSPGTDFIAISNTLIADLIRRDLNGQSIRRQSRLYERAYFSFYQSSLKIYRNQYELFGHARAMSAKTIWDYSYYWAVLALVFFSGRLTDTRLLARNGPLLESLRDLNEEIQTLFLEWSRQEEPINSQGLFINQSELPLLVRLNRELTEVVRDNDDQLDQRLARNADMLKRLASELASLAPSTAGGRLAKSLSTAKPVILDDLPIAFLQPETSDHESSFYGRSRQAVG